MKKSDITEITPTPTSHDLDVYKQTIISNGQIPNLTTFGLVKLKPNQNISSHSHPTMYEIYYITKGSAKFFVNGIECNLSTGQSIIIEPGEIHYTNNISETDCEWLYFGIATD
jgi:quercetin dioxygenase-like cupin family protein